MFYSGENALKGRGGNFIIIIMMSTYYFLEDKGGGEMGAKMNA